MKILMTTLLFISIKAFAYPQTIIKDYQLCLTCHVSPGGGTALNGYGRSMASDFMATWAIKNEVREFVTYDSPYVDYKATYRHLYLYSEEVETNFPMLADFELALHLGDILTFDMSAGVYSRDLQPETRQNFILVKPFRFMTFRFGHFMPVMGLGTNDHSLSIKQTNGLGRGSESYSGEIWLYWKRVGQLFLTVSANDVSIKSNPTNTYDVNSETVAIKRMRSSAFIGTFAEVGINASGVSKPTTWGAFLKWSPFWTTYILAEVDHQIGSIQSASWIRVGGFPFKGMDVYMSIDSYTEKKKSIGLDWMIRPGFEISASYYDDETFMSQLHIWR